MCKTENVTRRKFKVNLAILPSHRKRGMSKKQLCMSYKKRGALIRAFKTFFISCMSSKPRLANLKPIKQDNIALLDC